MKGQRIAVAGMGRSGMAIAFAAQKRGAITVLLDEQAADNPEKLHQLEQLESAGIEVICGWHGRLEKGDHDILVASPGFRRSHPAIQDALAAGIEVISEIEFAYRIAQGPILAITGTNGKSTTTVMAWLVLGALGLDPILCGNISGSGYPELTLTEAADQGKQGQPLVAEISSFQLEWVTDFRPRVAAITNITPDHLDRHPNFQDYFDTKLKIFQNMGEGDAAAICTEEPTLIGLEQRVPASVKRVFFQPGVLELDNLPFDEPYNLTNASQALAMAEGLLGLIDREKAATGLRKFEKLQYRMQKLGSANGIDVINNSMCTNPMAIIASSKGLPQPQILLIGGVTKNLDFAPVGEYLRTSGQRAILFGPNLDELRAMLAMELPWFESLEGAFHHATASSHVGDAIVLAPGCASAFPYANFRERGDAFERMAKEWLKNSPQTSA
ncbi:MAG: UDP-N-acetylmuramoyl-L-alanine--D-glutamate ligase [Armatimonadetes bacterium]|nr:UDP-N-acetylmuramoyl-L-alanine--D-glutamate ligase [Armatimonadota bacterium]